MARIKFGAIVTDARGSINGVTYARNRGGAYARTKVSPSQPRTGPQVSVRQTVADLVATYKNLVEADLISWRDLALLLPRTNSLGDVYFMTGQNTFISCNQSLRTWLAFKGDPVPAIIETAPSAADQPSVPTSAVANGLSYEVDYPTSGDFLAFFSSKPAPASKLFHAQRFLVQVVESAQGNNNQDLSNPLEDKFGSVVSGNTYSVQIKALRESSGFWIDGPVLTLVAP
jgi:hypothetical protein